MLFKKLTYLYFENKVRILPPGAMSFFGCLGEMENMFNCPGLIEINETDLLPLINKAEKITFAIIESFRSDIATDFKEKANKLLSKKADSVFFYVIGGGELTLYNINDIAEIIFTLLKSDADILFGASIDENLGENIKTVVLLTEKSN